MWDAMLLSRPTIPVGQQLGTFLLWYSDISHGSCALRVPYGPWTLVACVVRYLPQDFLANPLIEFTYNVAGRDKRLHVEEKLHEVFNAIGVHTEKIIYIQASCRAPGGTLRSCPFCLCGRCDRTWFDRGWQCQLSILPIYSPKRSQQEGGWVGCSIGLCGCAIVIWVNGLFIARAKGAHCTLFWRSQGFDACARDQVVALRNAWMAHQDRDICKGWMNVRLVLSKVQPWEVQYVVDECELLEFVYIARNTFPMWCNELVPTLVPHVTWRTA